MKRMLLIIATICGVGCTPNFSNAQFERFYQEKYCHAMQGITEYILDDQTRIDCLTAQYAIEVERAPKWAEAIGQSLYYAAKTDKRAAIILVCKDKVKDQRYLNRIESVIKAYSLDITVFVVGE